MNHSCFCLKFHIVLVVKYRRKIILGELNKNLKKIILEIAKKSDFSIDVMESDKNHIHILVDSVPKLSPLEIVRKLKQESTYNLWLTDETILKKYFWRERTLWTDGYFVCGVGENSLEIVQEYIRNQGSNSSPKLKT